MERIFRTITISVTVLLGLILATILCPPFGNTVFGIIGGSVYRKVGEAAFDARGYPRTLAIYKADNKPFLIVGPCLFHEGEDYKDFFFVNKKQLVRTATEDGCDIWGRTFGRLHIIDDLTDCDILRAPLWDELKYEGSSVRHDDATGSYVYSFTIDSHTIPAKLTIPAKFLTPDMDGAFNRTLQR